MKRRIERILEDVGGDVQDQTLVYWNTPPGAVVLIERLLERIHALEHAVESMNKPKPKLVVEKANVSENS